jgi:hypothetical protein
MSEQPTLTIQTHVMGIPVSIVAKNEEEKITGLFYLSFFVMSIFLPVAVIFQYQYIILAPIFFNNPIPFPSFMFYFFAWIISSILRTGTLFLLLFLQLAVLFLR